VKSEQELREFYRDDYAEIFERSQSRRRVARLLPLMELSLADCVADLGCGSGLLVPFVAPRVREYLGVDFSEEFIRIANRKLEAAPAPNVRFVCARVQDVAEAHSGEFDIAFALDFAEHVYDEAWLDILRGARRLLRPGGRFYLHTPNAGFFLERMKAANFLVRQFPEHVAVRSLALNADLLKQAGFTVVRTQYLPHYNVLKVVHPLSLIPPLRSVMSARIFIEARA
jgi:cyclopropane fatty-acyl-phospholipid synthase-like methyltransferase